jgi:hypothetical protein
MSKVNYNRQEIHANFTIQKINKIVSYLVASLTVEVGTRRMIFKKTQRINTIGTFFLTQKLIKDKYRRFLEFG